jgi:hypothetical protein
LGFAVMFATVITLVLVPCLYVMGQDMRKPFRAIKSKLRRKVPGDVKEQTSSV